MISILLPAYNEKDNIIPLIRDIVSRLKEKSVPYEILVIDDNSPDGTAAAIAENFSAVPEVRCVVRTVERGLGSAVGFGIEQAKYETVLLMDSDGNHDPKYIPIFLDLGRYYDVVSGSRFIYGGDMNGSRFRYLGSYFFNVAAMIILGLKTCDNLSAFVLFRKKDLSGLNFKKVFTGFEECYLDMMLFFQKSRLSIIEIPVVYPERKAGESKMKFSKTIFTYFGRVIQLKFSKTSLKSKAMEDIYRQVPPDYYETSYESNIFQRLWHCMKYEPVRAELGKFENGGKVLEVGCSSGFSLEKCLEGTKDICGYGIDIVEALIEYAKKKRPQFNFKTACGEELPFGDAFFDSVLYLDVLEHLNDPAQSLKEAHRTLKPGGSVMISVADESLWLFKIIWWLWKKTKGRVWEGSHLRIVNKQLLQNLVNAAGFQNMTVRSSHFGMVYFLRADK